MACAEIGNPARNLAVRSSRLASPPWPSAGLCRRSAFGSIRARMEELRRERDRGQASEGELRSNPLARRHRSTLMTLSRRSGPAVSRPKSEHVWATKGCYGKDHPHPIGRTNLNGDLPCTSDRAREAALCRCAGRPAPNGIGRLVRELALASGRMATQLRELSPRSPMSCAQSCTIECRWDRAREGL